MDKFMLVFHSPYSQETALMDMSPEAMQAEIQKWNTWIGGIAAQGKLIGTDALAPIGKTMTKGGQVITDGPFTEGKEIVGGYMLLTAASLDEAVELAKGCPMFDSEGTVEVRPIINFE
ncbi:YciI family protein [Spirosoma aerolatum]|uniref:YciI family protein n=1 Tax=Spirosoma aerolatum TaxID=1211326 RepID=UPI0009AE2CA0|nr:YciI family protein [Spirosoma aerolatum]